MAQVRYQLEVPKAGLNVAVGGVVQDYNIRALSIDGGFMAFGNALDALAGDFDPDFINLNPQKLRGTGERTGDTDDDRIVQVTSVAGDIIALRIPDNHPTDTVWVEVFAKLPF